MSDRDREPQPPSDDAGAGGPEDPSRRRALAIGVSVLGGGLVVAPLVPALGFVGFPLRGAVTSAGGDFIAAGSRAQFGPTIPIKVDLYADRRDAWAVERQVKIGSCWVLERDGELKAFSTVCPHLGCAIEYDEEASAFRCPCHRSEFDLDGTPVEGPSPRGLDTLEVKQDAGLVAIRYQRFRQGVGEKVEA